MSQYDICLIPLSYPKTGEISIDAESLLIGRGTRLFQDHWVDDFDKLSREHARIFTEDQRVFVCDLQSLNGTKVNDKPVGDQPVLLFDGDEICFADAIRYKIRIMAPTDLDSTILVEGRDIGQDGLRSDKSETLFITEADSYLDMLCEPKGVAEDNSSDHSSPKRRYKIAAILTIILLAAVVFYAVAYLRFGF